jgi:hypothetical protein
LCAWSKRPWESVPRPGAGRRPRTGTASAGFRSRHSPGGIGCYIQVPHPRVPVRQGGDADRRHAARGDRDRAAKRLNPPPPAIVCSFPKVVVEADIEQAQQKVAAQLRLWHAWVMSEPEADVKPVIAAAIREEEGVKRSA